jgi:hypothetical protein
MHGGAEVQAGGIRQYFEDLKRGANNDIFEAASSDFSRVRASPE